MKLYVLIPVTDLLRVVRRGPAVKSTVDDAIDQCAEVVNLRDSIEEARARAEQATDERQRKQYAHKGWSRSSLLNLEVLTSSGRTAEPTEVLRADGVPVLPAVHRAGHDAEL